MFSSTISPVWHMRAITPFHFTTDKFSANHTPLSKIFLKKKEAGQSVKAFDEVFRLWEGRTGRLCRLSALTLTYCEKISKSMPSFFKKIKIIWWGRRQKGRHNGHHTPSLYNGQTVRKPQPPIPEFFEKSRNFFEMAWVSQIELLPWKNFSDEAREGGSPKSSEGLFTSLLLLPQFAEAKTELIFLK